MNVVDETNRNAGAGAAYAERTRAPRAACCVKLQLTLQAATSETRLAMQPAKDCARSYSAGCTARRALRCVSRVYIIRSREIIVKTITNTQTCTLRNLAAEPLKFFTTLFTTLSALIHYEQWSIFKLSCEKQSCGERLPILSCDCTIAITHLDHGNLSQAVTLHFARSKNEFD